MDKNLNKYFGSEKLNTIPIKKIGIILVSLVFISGLSGCASLNCFLSQVKSKIFGCEVPDDDRDHISNACDDDWDNDGIVNASDSCETVFNSGNDSDRDGIDDVCDNCRYDANTGQEDSDNDLLGDACDDPDANKGINNIITLPDTPLNPGAPFWVTAKIQNKTQQDIQTLRPDCYNTYLILSGAQRLCRRGPAYGIPKDIVKIPAGGSFFVKCDLNDQFESFPSSGTHALKAIYENLIQDPEFNPSDPGACSKTADPECYPLWIGTIASTPKNVTIGSTTFRRRTADVSFFPSDWSAYYMTPSEEAFITVHISNIRDEYNRAPLPDTPLTLTRLDVADVDLASIKINGSVPCDSFIRKNEIISTCPANAVISSLGTVIPGNTIYPKIQGALKNQTNNEIYGYFSGSAKVTITAAKAVSIDIESRVLSQQHQSEIRPICGSWGLQHRRF